MRLEVLLILALVLVGGLIYFKDGSFSDLPEFPFFDNSTSTKSDNTPKTSIKDRIPFVGNDSAKKSDSASTPSLSSDEVDEQVAEIYEELDGLQENLREVELREPVSPFVGKVVLTKGNAKATDPQKENVIITANGSNGSSIEISDWYLESFVTDSKGQIPEGARLLDNHSSRTEDPIFLQPGEKAYIITGETPLRVSFRENECTGYLNEYGSFSPSLRKSCPLPGDELLQFANIKQTDDDCYEFVEDINKCEIVERDEREDADLTSSCNSFVKNVLDYEGCVDKHEGDPLFLTYGDWRIYLDRDGELWRSTREIIRLMDGNDRVIDIIEY